MFFENRISRLFVLSLSRPLPISSNLIHVVSDPSISNSVFISVVPIYDIVQHSEILNHLTYASYYTKSRSILLNKNITFTHPVTTQHLMYRSEIV